MAHIHGEPDKNELGLAICRLLGFEGKDVYSLVIDITAGSVASIKVMTYAQSEKLAATGKYIEEHYRLVPLEE